MSTTPVTLSFSPIRLMDKPWMDEALTLGHRGSLEYNFTSNFIWSEVYKLSAARFDDRLVVMSEADPEGPSFIFPSGAGPVAPVVRALAQYTKARGVPLVFNTVLNEDKEKLEAEFPGIFLFEEDRRDFDYVYDAQRLITLSGKKLSSKRNHVNRFQQDNRDWSYEAITLQNIGEAHQMSLEWCKQAGCRENPGLFSESCAVEKAFRHFFDLKLTGGLLRDGRRVVAYAMGEPLNPDTYIVHIEKAFYDVHGAYQMINQQFARENAGGFRYINREDDTGDEGLRRAKMSYDPELLVVKSSAVLTEAL